jgi:hypothetical protein
MNTESQKLVSADIHMPQATVESAPSLAQATKEAIWQFHERQLKERQEVVDRLRAPLEARKVDLTRQRSMIDEELPAIDAALEALATPAKEHFETSPSSTNGSQATVLSPTQRLKRDGGTLHKILLNRKPEWVKATELGKQIDSPVKAALSVLLDQGVVESRGQRAATEYRCKPKSDSPSVTPTNYN